MRLFGSLGIRSQVENRPPDSAAVFTYMDDDPRNVVQSPFQQRFNALQDELDRILGVGADSKRNIARLADFDLDALVHLISPELEAIDRRLNILIRNVETIEEVHPNRSRPDLRSIALAICEAKKSAYLIGVNVGLRMMGASRESIDDLLFNPGKSLKSGESE